MGIVGATEREVNRGAEAGGLAGGQEAEQLVVFQLGQELYGVDIGGVNAIIRMQGITRVPQAPEFVEGVTNLRGSTIPVIDLRQRLGLGAYEEKKSSRIVAIESCLGLVGLIVDAVTEIRSVPRDAVEPASSLVTAADSHCLRGVAKLDDELVIILLEIEQIVAAQEVDALAEAVPAFSEIEEPVAPTAAGRPEEGGASNPSTRTQKRSRTNGKRTKATAKVAVAAR